MSKLQKETRDWRKISTLSHGSILFSSTIFLVGIPLAIILLSELKADG